MEAPSYRCHAGYFANAVGRLGFLVACAALWIIFLCTLPLRCCPATVGMVVPQTSAFVARSELVELVGEMRTANLMKIFESGWVAWVELNRVTENEHICILRCLCAIVPVYISRSQESELCANGVALAQVPLALSGLIFFVMSCHHRGRNRELANQAQEEWIYCWLKPGWPRYFQGFDSKRVKIYGVSPCKEEEELARLHSQSGLKAGPAKKAIIR